MQLNNTDDRWGAVHQGLHWLIAVAVVSQLIIGYISAHLLEKDPLRATLVGLHTTLGLSILLVMLVRLIWRRSNPVPRLPDTLNPVEKRIARANHWFFYILLIGMPIGGYFMVNAYGHGVPFFSIRLPALIDKSESLGAFIFSMHVAGAIAIGVLVALHVLAALRHEFVLKDNTLRRMTPLPWRQAPAARGQAGGRTNGPR